METFVPVSGELILAELRRNLRAGAWRSEDTIYVPDMYHIYLHSEDYEHLRPILIRVARRDGRRALKAACGTLEATFVERLKGKMGVGSRRRVLDPPSGFQIDFHDDTER